MRKNAHYFGTAINVKDTNEDAGDVNTGDDYKGDEKALFGTDFGTDLD